MDALVASRIRDMRELLVALQNRDGRNNAEPNRTLGVHFRWMTEISPQYYGPDFRCYQHFGVRGFDMYNDIKPSPFELATAKNPM